MKRYISTFVIVIVAITSIGVAGTADAGKPIGSVIKGLYLGMDSEAAQETVLAIGHKLCGKSLKKKTDVKEKITGFRVTCKKTGYVSVSFNKQNRVNRIVLTFDVFGASDWPIEEFAKAFINAYHIPELDVKQKHHYNNLGGMRTLTTYFYNDRKAGYSVTIDDILLRVVTIELITKTSELNFN